MKTNKKVLKGDLQDSFDFFMQEYGQYYDMASLYPITPNEIRINLGLYPIKEQLSKTQNTTNRIINKLYNRKEDDQNG